MSDLDIHDILASQFHSLAGCALDCRHWPCDSPPGQLLYREWAEVIAERLSRDDVCSKLERLVNLNRGLPPGATAGSVARRVFVAMLGGPVG